MNAPPTMPPEICTVLPISTPVPPVMNTLCPAEILPLSTTDNRPPVAFKVTVFTVALIASTVMPEAVAVAEKLVWALPDRVPVIVP